MPASMEVEVTVPAAMLARLEFATVLAAMLPLTIVAAAIPALVSA